MIRINQQNTGFALLMSLIVVGVVISIGLVVLDLTLKQLRLSTNSKDSETAFHAANAAMECARYWRVIETDTFASGGDLPNNMECFGEDIDSIEKSAVLTVGGDGDAFIYSFSGVTWGGESERCSQIDILVLNSEIDLPTVVEDMSIIPGFPEPEKECQPGGRCTVIAARGYSRGCGEISAPGTVEREVLLEL